MVIYAKGLNTGHMPYFIGFMDKIPYMADHQMKIMIQLAKVRKRYVGMDLLSSK